LFSYPTDVTILLPFDTSAFAGASPKTVFGLWQILLTFFGAPFMTNHRAILKAIPAVLLVCASGFASADTQNLTVSATVTGVCQFTSAAQTLTFGSFDALTAAPIAGAGAAVTYKCTKNTVAATASAGNGLHHTGTSRAMKNSGNADVIPYALNVAASGTTPDGFGAGSTNLALTITGSIALASDYNNVSAGSYADTVQLTVTP
jgi:spore coat protein U-like protein